MWKKAIRDILQVVVLALIIFLGIRAVVQNHFVDGVCMEPGIQDGQLFLVNKTAYWFGSPQRGDIIVFHYPKNREQDFIKRIIGLPGETIQIKDGKTYIDGHPIDEPYLNGKPRGSFPARQIPQGHYFVMGDNRNNSYDSRAWGTVLHDDIVGYAWLSIWPIDRWGPLPNYSVASGPR